MANETRELLVATRNTGKVAEIESLLAGMPARLRSLEEFPGAGEVEETGSSFEENAVLKAREYARRTGLLSLADDSGLEVDALGGRPGVYSARYGGEGLTYPERIVRLLREMDEAVDAERRARFVCVIAVAAPDGEVVNVSAGKCEGRIAFAPRGANGFGYDPVFEPEGYELTFGELPEEVKQKISHRARALAAASSFLLDYL